MWLASHSLLTPGGCSISKVCPTLFLGEESSQDWNVVSLNINHKKDKL